MVAINLFHKPSFGNKIAGITCQVQISALLAAMLGYAARFYLTEPTLASQYRPRPVPENTSPEYFLNKAVKLIDESLTECDDAPPPICVVQALIITTHCQLTRGVHGKAWRSLGMCVRLAYELNLHLIDARSGSRMRQRDPVQWRDDEEKRRAWWAIWEMDVFASTIRRTPTALDWAHMETLLPVDDTDWSSDRPASSTFLARDPIQRWKTLEATGNHSPKAWFLVINSLMKDAQLISDPMGVSSEPDMVRSSASPKEYSNGTSPSTVKDARQQLEMLANAVKCFVLALPQHLRYNGLCLTFDPPESPRVVSMRQLHCGIYNIFVMTQLARLMIHRYHLFRQPAYSGQSGREDRPDSSSGPMYLDMDNLCIRQYFEAADNILTIVSRSSEDHIRHINPFLLSTIWLACAAQLVRKYLGPAWINPSLVKSRYDVLYLTYKRCVSFWDAKTALQENLESLEMHLERHFQVTEDEAPRTSWARESLAQRRMVYSSCVSDHSNPGQQATNRLSAFALQKLPTRGH
ncbi:unnamed protein product [Clonostachys solani]|uniref:Xylanolytic transcriptional activator regulatory domain-containing protein n=1 Tax=Clonostachys solani TaxID=160281 RepID=A0A9N9ZAM3_9HYPO|nr:unnamed protein product [Clonostachys solani]